MLAHDVEDIDLGDVHHGLVERLVTSTALKRPEALRVVGDVLDHFSESTVELVRRRHHELKAERRTNAVAFEAIRLELALQRVRPPDLSLRQLRRIVYG